MYIQSSVGKYQGTLMSCHTVNITCYILLVTQGNKIYIFIFLKYLHLSYGGQDDIKKQYHDNDKYRNIVRL